MNFLSKIKIFLKRPKVVIITGLGRQTAKAAILQVLKQYFRVGSEIVIFETELKETTDIKNFNFLVKNSSLPILVVTHIGDISPFDRFDKLTTGKLRTSPEKDFFAGKGKNAPIKKLEKFLPSKAVLILNYDDEELKEMREDAELKKYTFGFREEADFYASDIKINGGLNFKINYKGNTVPVWLESSFNKEHIYAALAASAVGEVLDLNLVEISQALKDYQGLLRRE